MAIAFDHVPHPHIAGRRGSGPPKTADEHIGLNGRIGLMLTTVVGTMWCAYAFALLALIALPNALDGGLFVFIEWLSQSFIQLVLLSVVLVGQNILGRAADRRAEMTYRDADAILTEVLQLQAHLGVQDAATTALLTRLERIEARIASA